jgi:hypothetical protein
VSNPSFDRRAKHGIRATETFPSGMPFIYSATVREPGVPGRHPASITTARHAYEMGPVVAALLAASEPSEPENWREAKLAGDAGSWERAGDMVLQLLLDRGVVTMAQLLEAVRALHDRPEDSES